MAVRSRVVALLLPVFALTASAAAQTDTVVTLQPSVHHQTILGWGKTTPWFPASGLLRDQCIDVAVNDFGLNRLRFEGLCGNRTTSRSWEWLNDNDDPHRVNWQGFNTRGIDARARDWLVPWKRAVEARGEEFNLYVSPSFFRNGSSGDVPPWMLDDPDEYAEWALALLYRLREEHGITADYYCICNEAGNGNAFTPQVVGRMTRALMPRMRAQGFRTMLQFPESINAQVAWQYIEALQDDPDFWRWVGLISYHWYGRENQTWMERLREFAHSRRLPTAQTEYMHLTIDHLYDDLTIGDTSFWEVYGLAGPDYEKALSHVSSDTFRGGPWYWPFRQVSHYVRPGAVRIGAESSDPDLRCLAFTHNGRATVVLINTKAPAQDRDVLIRGLPPGTYGLSHCIHRRPYAERGTSEVGRDGTLRVPLAAGAVLTVYPHGGGNMPPTITRWLASPHYLTLPASSVRLTCSATDPEMDEPSYGWSVLSAPAGASVELSSESGEQIEASRLTVPGDYVFAVSVEDGHNTATRRVMVRVFDGNQPPVPVDVHNRIPVWVTVQDGGTLLRGHAWDIEHDPLRYRWSVVRQPRGARAQLETPNEAGCKVNGMTAPGEYVFRLQISDPTHTVSVDHSVPVYR